MKSQVLFAAHRDGVFRYLCRIVGQGDAPDLTQEVFLRVARSPLPETTADGERAWVYRIARNLALNHIRDGHRRPTQVALVEQTASASQELSMALAQALASLGALDRDVFLLRESGGLTYEEIAQACDLTAVAVRSRLHRARLQLRSHLAGPLHRRAPQETR